MSDGTNEIILSCISSMVQSSVNLSPLTAFYVVGFQTMSCQEKKTFENFPGKHSKKMTQDFVGTCLNAAVQIETLVDLLIRKKIFTDGEFNSQYDINVQEFSERKQMLHRRYFRGILESLQ